MSENDCKNDCTLPLRFPRRPGTVTVASHGGECDCGCNQKALVSSDNRPALNKFNYRIGTYGSIREFLFHQLDKTPELEKWSHRWPDDPAVALIEGAAILGDILTFYQETYANEAYLRTASWRESIADLVRLLGYRLSPALGGNAVLAFELKKDEPVVIPVGFPVKATLEELPKPAEFETLEEITAYPWLNRFNLFRPLVQADIAAATTEFYISGPHQLIDPIDIKVGERILVFEPSSGAISGSVPFASPEIVIVDSMREMHGRKYYKIKGNLKRTSNIGSLYAFRISRTFHHFGYNSPSEIVDPSAEVTSTATVSGQTTTTSSTIPMVTVAAGRPVVTSANSFHGSAVSKPFSDTEFPIDSDVKDLATGMKVVIQAPYWEPPEYLLDDFEYTADSFDVNVIHNINIMQSPGGNKGGGSKLYQQLDPAEMLSVKDQVMLLLGQVRPLITTVRTIKDIRTTTLDWGGISGTVSQLTLNSSLGGTVGNDQWMQINDALFHEVTSPLMTLKRAEHETTASEDNKLNYYGTKAEAESLSGRRIMLEKLGDDPWILNVSSVAANPPTGTEKFRQLYEVTLSDDVAYADFPNGEPSVTVFGNIVDADEGKTLPEAPIGSGDATQVFQNFKLPKAPLTYHIVPQNTPAETPDIAIYVDGREWKQVDSLFGREDDEQIYIVREDPAGGSWAQFGDGKTGARLTTGVNNVTCVYRTGAGAYGPLKADTKVQASAKLKNLDKIGMPMEATGGSEPEDGENARNAAPGKVQSLGRIVSLKDFESEALGIAGVASASAAWRLVSNTPSVVVTVLMDTGRGSEISAVQQALTDYNFLRGAGRHPVIVEQGKRLYVAVSLDYVLKPSYRADLVEPVIRRALGVNYGGFERDEDQTGLFSMRRRRFGGSEYASSIEGHTQNVEGVLWAISKAFCALGESDDPAPLVPGALTSLDEVPCDEGQILSLYDKHLVLNATAE